MIAALLVHVGVACLSATCLGLVWGRLTPAIAALSLLVGLAAGVVTYRLRDPEARAPFSVFDALLLCGVGTICFKHFAWLFFFDAGSWWTLNPNNLGDLPLHITYIRVLADGGGFWPENPVFAGDRLGYPLGIDLYNALWELLGVGLAQHLFAVGCVLALCGLLALHRWLGWLGVGAFFLGAAYTGQHAQYLGPLAHGGPWKNLFLALLVTQRGFLFALPAGALLLHAAWRVFFQDAELSRREWLRLGFLWAVLPLFHVHSFLVVTLLLLLGALVRLRVREGLRLLPWAPLAIGLGLLVSGGPGKAGVIGWNETWVWEQGDRYAVLVWLDNWRLWCVPVLGAFVLAVRRSDRARLAYLAGVTVLFVLFNLVKMAPWGWDTIKVLVWVFLAFLTLPAEALRAGERRRPWLPYLLAPLLLLPGVLALFQSVRPFQKGVELYTQSELILAKQPVKALPPDAVVLVAPTFDHPVSFFGRRVVMGYPGHVWSHGIQQEEGGRERLVDAIFKGEPGWRELALGLGATHLAWSQHERARYRPPRWRTLLRRTAGSTPDFELYELADE